MGETRTAEPHAEILDVAACARLLGISPTTLYRLRDRGEAPPSFLVGRLVRWRRSAVLNWIAAQETASPAPKARRRRS